MIKRTALSMRQKQVLWDKQQGLCAVEKCRVPLKHGDFEDDHWTPLHLNGTNDLANRRLICVPCHRRKSAGEHVANCKVKRIARKIAGTWKESKRAWPSRKMGSRPFQKRKKA